MGLHLGLPCPCTHVAYFWRRGCGKGNYLRPGIPTGFVMMCDSNRPSAIFWFTSYISSLRFTKGMGVGMPRGFHPEPRIDTGMDEGLATPHHDYSGR